jgi:hypothetical protein
VYRHIVLGIAAWLAGASAATGGSLLAVSVLDQGMTASAGDQPSLAAVNRALAKEAAGPAAAMPRHAGPGPASPVAPPRAARTPARPASPRTTGGTVLTSQGGTLVATCTGARAYLVSWSPQQGFGASDVVRGPATNAQVVFVGGQVTVTMIVSCDAGVPAATATALSAGGTAAGTAGSDGD